MNVHETMTDYKRTHCGGGGGVRIDCSLSRNIALLVSAAGLFPMTMTRAPSGGQEVATVTAAADSQMLMQ
jgi:hypothetical protein